MVNFFVLVSSLYVLDSGDSDTVAVIDNVGRVLVVDVVVDLVAELGLGFAVVVEEVLSPVVVSAFSVEELFDVVVLISLSGWLDGISELSDDDLSAPHAVSMHSRSAPASRRHSFFIENTLSSQDAVFFIISKKIRLCK